jgi:tRNA A37 threonylcarbamoyladenosine synthetase subunit TsaC/SUA5/YrdC
MREHLEKLLDLVIDAGQCGTAMTTVINLTGTQPELVRAGQGPLAPFGLD